MKEKYIQIKKLDVPGIFEIVEHKVYLKNSSARPIFIHFPLKLNEDVAKIAAMLLDGSLSKDLQCCIFSQKKDSEKITEIRKITKKYFGIGGSRRISKKTGIHEVSYPKTFSHFLYYCIGMYKSDQFAGIPSWIWESPLDVIREYLRYAFAMEGSVRDSRRGKEIRFHSCDLPYVKELKMLLSIKYGINSKIYRYYIKDYGWKYYLYFEKATDVVRFYNSLGFALDSHQERLKTIVKSIKAKAWEITLVKLLDLNILFEPKEVLALFPYLCYRAINHRLAYLIDQRYVAMERSSYTLTQKGIIKATSLKEFVKIVPLRTKPEDNESNIMDLLNEKGVSYNAEMARELNINSATIRGALKRLQIQQKIRLVSSDRFQRKFYEINKEKNPGGKNSPPSSS